MSSRGFTLIELLVSISIFILMTLLVISRYGAFNQNTLLTNLAYDMALTIQTAQTYGVSVAATSTGTSQSFNAGYGIELDLSSPSKFVLFGDNNLNGYYDIPDTSINSYNLTQGALISSVCAGMTLKTCSPLAPNAKVDITFRRPNPTAIVYFCVSTCSTMIPIQYQYMKITLTSGDKSNTQTVFVRENGQISVGS